MLCNQCRRVATIAVRQLASSAGAQSTHARPTSTPRATILSRYTKRGNLPYTTPMRYSTASGTTATTTPTSVPEKPDFLDTAESDIWDKLTAELSPSELTVRDISGGCGSMYNIEITSEKFRGANMLKQQRMVNTVLGEQLKGWHGVQLKTKVPA